MEEEKDNTNYNHKNPSDREDFRTKNDTVGITEELDYAITLIKHYTKDTYKKGATIAVHACYGGGKTFFATKLEDNIKEIKLDDKEDKNIIYTPIYINMWQNDYKDPLLTILESLNLEKTTWSKIKKRFKSHLTYCICWLKCWYKRKYWIKHKIYR